MIKAEYIMLRHITREAIWIIRFINKMRLEKVMESLTLHNDNKMSIALTKNI